MANIFHLHNNAEKIIAGYEKSYPHTETPTMAVKQRNPTV